MFHVPATRLQKPLGWKSMTANNHLYSTVQYICIYITATLSMFLWSFFNGLYYRFNLLHYTECTSFSCVKGNDIYSIPLYFISAQKTSSSCDGCLSLSVQSQYCCIDKHITLQLNPSRKKSPEMRCCSSEGHLFWNNWLTWATIANKKVSSQKRKCSLWTHLVFFCRPQELKMIFISFMPVIKMEWIAWKNTIIAAVQLRVSTKKDQKVIALYYNAVERKWQLMAWQREIPCHPVNL